MTYAPQTQNSQQARTFDPADIGTFTANDLRAYVSGGAVATNSELAMLLTLCKTQNMNPFTKDVYFIKYKKDTPAQIVVSRDFYRKRAFSNPNFNGLEGGLIVRENGEVTHTEGSFSTPEQQILGAWANVYVNGISLPFKVSVSYSEYVGTKDEYINNRKTGKKFVTAMWQDKPGTMILKVAEAQALRLAFPAEFAGTYAAEELNDTPTPKDVTQQPQAREELTEPTAEEMANFNPQEYARERMAQLEQEQQAQRAREEQAPAPKDVTEEEEDGVEVEY